MVERFTEPEPNVIESSEGFSIRVLGRTGMRYSEGERSVWIDCEVLANPKSIALAKASIRFWEGEDPDAIGEQERNQLTSNIKRAFDACRYELEINEPFDWESVALRRPNEPCGDSRAAPQVARRMMLWT